MERRNDYIKKWRQTESGKKSVKKYRDASKAKRKEFYKNYYKRNRDKIIKKTTEYRINNPDVSKKSQYKSRQKNINRGRKDRDELKPHYVKTLIRIANEDVSIEQKSASVLIKRINKEITGLGDTKVCTGCNQNLPNSDFTKHGKTSNGRQRYNNYCKTCYSKRRKKYNLDRNKIIASNKRYYLKKKKGLNE